MWASALYSVYSSEQLHKYWPVEIIKNGAKAVSKPVCIESFIHAFRVSVRSSHHQ